MPRTQYSPLELLKIRQRLDDSLTKSPDVNSSMVILVNYAPTQSSMVNIFTELMKNEKFALTGKLKYSKIAHNEFTVEYCSHFHADKSTNLIIDELRSKNIEIRANKKVYSNKKISSSFINKHTLDAAFPAPDEKEQEKMIMKNLLAKNDFFFNSSSDLLSISLCNKYDGQRNTSVTQIVAMVSDDTWNKFLKYDGQSAKTLELNAIHNPNGVAFFCNINPPFCSQCFDYKHSKSSCPFNNQFCDVCGQLHESEDCSFDVGCANCRRNGKTNIKHFYYYHKCPFRREVAINLENALFLNYNKGNLIIKN